MYLNAIFICISWYNNLLISGEKNFDVGRTQAMCHVIYIFFESLGKV